MNVRATYDAQVVRAWERALAAHPPLLRKVATVTAIVAVVGLGGAVASYGNAFAPVLFGSGISGLVLAALLRVLDEELRIAHLHCPHCLRKPAGLRRQNATSTDHCVHCLYWLKTPPWIEQAPDALDNRQPTPTTKEPPR